MAEFSITPGEGFGPIRFGMRPADVKAAMREPEAYEDWMGGNLNDSLLYRGLVLTFDGCDSSGPLADSRLDGISVHQRDGVLLFGRPMQEWSGDELARHLESLGHPVDRGSGWLHVPTLGLRFAFGDGPAGRLDYVDLSSHTVALADLARLPANVKLLGAASLLNDVASEMVYPLLPEFLFTVLGGDKRHLGVIEGVADSAGSLLKLWSGGWSDRAGRRKPFIVCGYTVPALARPLIALAAAPWQLFAVRVVDRLGKGLRTAPRDALIADSTLPAFRGRAFGFHRALDHLGAALGPLVALGFLWLWPGELRTLFALSLVPGVAVALLVLWGLKERAGSARPVEASGAGRLALRPPEGRFRAFLAALVLFTLGNSSDMFLLVRSGELGVPTEWLPLLWCAFHVVKSLANLAAGRVVDALGPRPLIVAGWLLYGVVYLAFALAAAAWHAWALFLVYGVVYSLTEPAEKTLVARLVRPEQKGLAYGWFNFAIGAAALPSSIAFGWLYETWGALAAFGWGAALAVAAAAMLTLVREQGELADGGGVS